MALLAIYYPSHFEVKMFSKPFRVKSNTMMRNSDKRKLRSRLEGIYGQPFNQVADELLPLKADITSVAVVLHRGDVTDLFCVDGSPLFFESQPEQVLLPTVYALWKCPALTPPWLTWVPVVSKLQKGADLMLPGVGCPVKSADAGLGEFGRFSPRSVATPDNAASVGVGVTAISSSTISEQLATGFELRGKGLLMRHTVLDHLWLYGSKTQRPSIDFSLVFSSDTAAEETTEAHASSEGAMACAVDASQAPSAAAAEGFYENAENKDVGQAAASPGEMDSLQDALTAACVGTGEQEEETPAESMDDLLEKCFLLALGCRLKKTDLPVLTSSFYRTHMQSCCPSGKSLDIKHSGFKKLSRFLAAMGTKFGCITVKETSKGVDSLVAVVWTHPAIRQAKSQGAADLPPATDGGEATESPTPVFSLYLSPSVDLLPVFSSYGHDKNSLLTDNDVKQAVTRYVRDNELVSPQDRGSVLLNDTLSRALRTKGEPAPTLLRWDALMHAVKSKMLSRHQVSCVNGNFKDPSVHMLRKPQKWRNYKWCTITYSNVCTCYPCTVGSARF